MTARPDTGTGRDTRAHVAAGHHTNTTTRGDLMTSTTPTAGGILAAAQALQDPTRETYSREQVAYLLHLSYESGRTARFVGDLAELHAGWARNPAQRVTAEERYRQRMAEMAAAAAQVNAELGRPPGYRYDGGPVAWEPEVTA